VRDSDDGTRVPPKPSNPASKRSSNAFDEDFLERFDEENEPPTASEAEVAGLGGVRPLPDGGFGLFLHGEGPERGHQPVGVFPERWRALMASAVLPGTGRDPLVVLRKEADPAGYALLSGLDLDGRPEVVGHLRVFDEAFAEAMHVAEALLRSPQCLAALLEAAGKVALEKAGKVLDGQVRG
jgi:hypothetical protein